MAGRNSYPGLVAIHADVVHRPAQDAARRPYEWRALDVLAIALLLTDEHQAGPGQAGSEDGLCGGFIQVAALAACCSLSQRLQITSLLAESRRQSCDKGDL